MMPSLKRLLIPLAAVLAVFAVAAPSALASSGQTSILEDNVAINKAPAKTLATLKEMGVTTVKYSVYWADYARNAKSTSAPAGNMTDPAYWNFGPLAEIATYAHAYGINLMFMVTSPVPRWAEKDHSTKLTSNINTADFQAFMTALGSAFSGHYANYPRVDQWSIWNEPNYIPNLSPQNVGTLFSAADQYRGLVAAAWNGLHASGHAGDTFLIGEVAPRGIAGTKAQNAAGSKPVTFLANVYCQTSPGHKETGAVARKNGCSTSSSAFRRANPGLFDATGVANHPYAQGTAPNVPTYDCSEHVGGRHIEFCENPRTKKGDPLWTDLGQLNNLTSGLDRDLRAWGSGKRYAVYNTEFGYWYAAHGQLSCSRRVTSDCGLSAADSAYYDNWAEYVSYRNPRVASFNQYQLVEPAGGGGGNWTDGLLSASGRPTSTFSAFEVPLYMPTTSARRASNLTVWGAARAFAANRAIDTVAIQFKAGKGGWTTVKTVKLSNPQGYFQTTARFTHSGSVRLVAGGLDSRTQAITVR